MSTKHQYNSTVQADQGYSVNAPQDEYLTTTTTTTDQADAAVVRTVHDLAGKTKFSWDCTGVMAALNSVALTIWLTNDSSADDSADTGWHDHTTAITGGASVAFGVGATTLAAYEYATAFRYAMIKKVYTVGNGSDNVMTEHFRGVFT